MQEDKQKKLTKSIYNARIERFSGATDSKKVENTNQLFGSSQNFIQKSNNDSQITGPNYCDQTRWEPTAPQASSTPQELVYRDGFKAADNDYEADKVTRCHLQNMRYSEIENCMQRTKYYVLHY
jgi:hypothetical protein